MTPDTLRHLHAFQAVAECGGVRSAGSVLVRDPSTVTRTVAGLERMLAAELFERGAHGMRLTRSGERVLAHARRIAAILHTVHRQALRSRLRSGPVAAVEALFSERRLRLAVLLADLGRMPKVARASDLSQPAVSQAITRLEADLGQALFVRGAGGMAPTEAGGRWIGRFNDILDELDRLRRGVDGDADGNADGNAGAAHYTDYGAPLPPCMG